MCNHSHQTTFRPYPSQPLYLIVQNKKVIIILYLFYRLVLTLCKNSFNENTSFVNLSKTGVAYCCSIFFTIVPILHAYLEQKWTLQKMLNMDTYLKIHQIEYWSYVNFDFMFWSCFFKSFWCFLYWSNSGLLLTFWRLSNNSLIKGGGSLFVLGIVSKALLASALLC